MLQARVIDLVPILRNKSYEDRLKDTDVKAKALRISGQFIEGFQILC